VVVLTVGLFYAGWHQGHQLNNDAVAFGDITKALTFWFTVRSIIFGLLLLGHVAFFINFFWIACPINSKGTAPVQFRNPPALSLGQGSVSEGHA